jgi:phosphoserine phosphatase RsbU/P
MARHLTLRAKILWIAFGINALCTTVYTVDSCREQRKVFLQGIDQKLRTAAYALPLILPQGYHDRITGPDSVSPEEYRRVVELLTDYADHVGVKYVYTYLMYEGRFREASSSDSEEDRASGVTTPFLFPYDEPPPSMLAAWHADSVRYAEYTDEWGHFRSIFVPLRTPNGTRFIAGADVTMSFIQERLRRLAVMGILLGLGIFLVVGLISGLVLTRILSPITQLTSYTKDLSQQDFQLPEEQRQVVAGIARRRQDEIGLLAEAFLEMQAKLLEYLENLKRTTAAKERIESELRVAHDIQMSFLQKVFPPFPQRTEFDLYAMLEPAKEVGGDLYDFCLLDDGRLFFYVGDVSDKGVPAALFMAVTMTLMKRSAQQEEGDPAEILRRVNGELFSGNVNLLFVTLCCCTLDVKTGEFFYSNAGHNPPVILRRDGPAEWLQLPDGIVLGVIPDPAYETRRATLRPGDTIVLYTDGVTEAMSPARELYSDERLLATVASLAAKDATETTHLLLASVKEHAAGAPASDDITILSLKYRGT